MKLLGHLKAHRLQGIAFITGLVLMVFELIAARLLAPYVGGSLYVWTSVIGVIIAALSLGYWTGGALADARRRYLDVIVLMLATGLTMTMTLLVYQSFLEGLIQTNLDTRIQAVVAAAVLFAPASYVLGMISPYLVKLDVESLDVAGRRVASLSALNSIGGIIGTFLAGFFLFGWIGSRETLAALVIIVTVTSWCLSPGLMLNARLAATIVLVSVSALAGFSYSSNTIDTAAARYSIVEWRGDTGNITRGFMSGPHGIQSGVDIHNPTELVFWYTRQLAEVVDASPSKQRILMLGGGTLTLPQALAKQYPDSQIDVVEIDHELFDLAREKFMYTDPENIELIADDARRYVATSDKLYDVILIDVFQDGQIPFSLTTHQFARELDRRLSPDGVLALNIIAGDSGSCGELLASMNRSFVDSFGQGKVNYRTTNQRSNLIAVYNQTDNLSAQYIDLNLQGGVKMTDNFAPISHLTSRCQN